MPIGTQLLHFKGAHIATSNSTIYLLILELMVCAWSVEITSKEKVALTFEIPKCLQKLGGDLLGFSL